MKYLAAAAVFSLAFLHGDDPPLMNRPDVQGACYDGTFEHDYWIGAEPLHFAYYNQDDETWPFDIYVTKNGQDTTLLDPCGQYPKKGYLTAGQLGERVLATTLTNPITELPPGCQAWVIMSWDWMGYDLFQDGRLYPIWIPAGFTALGPTYWPDQLHIAYTAAEEVRLATGEHVGWRRVYNNPVDPAFVGISYYYQAVLSLPDGTFRLSGTWRNTFTDEPSVVALESEIVYNPVEANPRFQLKLGQYPAGRHHRWRK